MLIYRMLMTLAAPWLIALTLWQRLRGRVGTGAVWQRLGWVALRDAGPALWLHGASNGEVTSARWVIEAVLAARPGLAVLVTANTGTAVAMAASWNLPGVQVALAPLDALGAGQRVLRRWRPDALIIVENELWPGRLAAASAAGVPVALIGARMSERSAAGWTRVAPGLLRRGLSGLAVVSAQDAASAARLRALGVPPDRMLPEVMLKAQVSRRTGVAGPVARERVVLAASTHAGEEATVLAAFAGARNQFDLLILAPRHPRRAAEVAGVIASSGLAFTRRSEGAAPAADVPVFLADTMGEMALWYAMAGATVIGGSFAPHGGHTPFEPAAAGSAILHGPHMENFAEATAALAAASGAVAVDRNGLGSALATMTGPRQARLARAASAALRPGAGRDALIARMLSLLAD